MFKRKIPPKIKSLTRMNQSITETRSIPSLNQHKSRIIPVWFIDIFYDYMTYMLFVLTKSDFECKHRTQPLLLWGGQFRNIVSLAYCYMHSLVYFLSCSICKSCGINEPSLLHFWNRKKNKKTTTEILCYFTRKPIHNLRIINNNT